MDGRALMNETSTLKETPPGTLFPIMQCEDIVRRWLVLNQEVRPHKMLNLSCTSQAPEL